MRFETTPEAFQRVSGGGARSAKPPVGIRISTHPARGARRPSGTPGGVAVGVSGLRLVDPHAETIHLLAQLGIVLLLFLIGLNTELSKLVAVWPAALIVAVAGVVLTFMGGWAVAHVLHYPNIVALFL